MSSRIGAHQQTQKVRQPSVDLSPAIIASLQAVRDNPTDATVNSHAAELNRALSKLFDANVIKPAIDRAFAP